MLVALAAGGLVLGAVGTALVLTSDHEENKSAFLSLALTVGLSFLVSGVIALWRRPDNRTGVLLDHRRLPVVPRWVDALELRLDLHPGRAAQQLRAGGVRPPAARVPVRPARRTARRSARDRRLRARLRRLLRAAPGRGAARQPLPRLHEHDRRHRQRHRLDDRQHDRQPAGARARRRDPPDRRDPLRAGARRAAARARPRARHRRARDARPPRLN